MNRESVERHVPEIKSFNDAQMSYFEHLLRSWFRWELRESGLYYRPGSIRMKSKTISGLRRAAKVVLRNKP